MPPEIRQRPAPNFFVAFPLALERYLGRLPPPPRGVRLFSPSDLHITLAFLGRVTEEAARAGLSAAGDPDLPPTRVTFEGFRMLGNRRKPSAITLVLAEGREALAGAIGRLRGPILEAAGAPPETREPLPHATIARIQRKASSEQRRAALRWAEALPLPEESPIVERVALYTWSERREETLFQELASRSLARPQ